MYSIYAILCIIYLLSLPQAVTLISVSGDPIRFRFLRYGKVGEGTISMRRGPLISSIVERISKRE